MSSCTACGHQLGGGRFCTNCGAPVAAPTPPDPTDSTVDTAERAVPIPAEPPTPAARATSSPTRSIDPRTPPSAVAPPPPPRYPLYADEVADWRPYGPLVATEPPPVTPAEPVEAQPVPVPVPEPVAEPVPEPISAGQWVEETPEEPAYDEPAYQEPAYEEWAEDDDQHRSPLLWVLAAVVVLGVVATGWYYLARDTGSDQTASDSTKPSASSSPSDVAGQATAQAPGTAPPNVDVDGKKVTYAAANMLDGDPTTAWRMPGSGAGTTLTFTLDSATEISSVGMINGYAKTSTDDQGRTFDWYAGNRRIKAVVWGFDDGTKVRQQLEDKDRDVQSIDVDPVTTKKVTVKIVRVTNPGTGTSARNFTAISEVSLVGAP